MPCPLPPTPLLSAKRHRVCCYAPFLLGFFFPTLSLALGLYLSPSFFLTFAPNSAFKTLFARQMFWNLHKRRHTGENAVSRLRLPPLIFSNENEKKKKKKKVSDVVGAVTMMGKMLNPHVQFFFFFFLSNFCYVRIPKSCLVWALSSFVALVFRRFFRVRKWRKRVTSICEGFVRN